MATGIVADPKTWTAGRRKRDGKRFFFVPGQKPGVVYMTAVDGCTCPSAQNSHDGGCKHQAAVRRVMQPEPIRIHRARFEDLYPACRTDGCHDIGEGADQLCNRCASEREWNERRESMRQQRGA